MFLMINRLKKSLFLSSENDPATTSKTKLSYSRSEVQDPIQELQLTVLDKIYQVLIVLAADHK